MSEQNKLNIFLQGKSKCIDDMWSKIQAIRKKLEFLKNTLAEFELPEAEEHFSQLTKAPKNMNGQMNHLRNLYLSLTL